MKFSSDMFMVCIFFFFDGKRGKASVLLGRAKVC